MGIQCLGNAGISNQSVNISDEMVHLNSQSAGVFQFVTNAAGYGYNVVIIGEAEPYSDYSVALAWGKTFDLAAAALGGGILSYPNYSVPGINWNTDESQSPATSLPAGQLVFSAGATIDPFGFVVEFNLSPPIFVSQQYIDPTRTDNGVPTGVNPLTGEFANVYWHGGESIQIPGLCAPYNMFGGTFNSGNCGLIYFGGLNVSNVPPPNIAVNVNYIPMMPNLVMSFGGSNGTMSPFAQYPLVAGCSLEVAQNLSNQFAWPNVSYKLLPGPNNLAPVPGYPGPNPGPGQMSVTFNLPASSTNLGYIPFWFTGPDSGIVLGGGTHLMKMPFVIEIGVYMNGILADTLSYTIQPAVSATWLYSPISGTPRFSFTLTNSGYGLCTNLKFSVACNNPNVKLSTGYGGGLSNQASLNNVPLFQEFGQGSAQPVYLFECNKLNGSTPVQFTVTFQDDTFTYPPMTLNVVF